MWVLRLTHRSYRDKRISTHVALVARAFGALGLYYSGDRDIGFENKVFEVCSNWGGIFHLEYVRNPINVIKNWRMSNGKVVHLTMYGIPIPHLIDEIRGFDNVLVVVGSEKVDSKIFKLVDYNVSVTNQPHSEIAALAIFLDYYYRGREFFFEFEDAKYKVVPSERGKKVVKS